jgi:NarL family two-component system response regulator LiaR
MDTYYTKVVFGIVNRSCYFVLPMQSISTISIIEDDVKFGLLLKKLIDSEPDLTCASIYTNLKSSLNDLASFTPDVVLLDVQLPDGLGSDYVQVLKKVSPTSLFIMCTSFEDDTYIFDSLKNGASGYIVKSASPEQLLTAIRDVLAGGAPMSSTIARKVVNYFQVETRKMDELTPKENELLALLAEGLFYKEIADKMHISIDTVKKHASTIYRKLQVSNRTEAVNRYKS